MPSEKRERHRQGRQARMAELRRAQQRKKNRRRGAIVAVIVVIFAALAYYTSTRGSSKKTKVTTGSTVTTVKTGATTTVATGPTTTVAPLSTTALEAALVARPAPATSAACNAVAATPTAPTTTIPAKDNAVSVVDAPAGVGFPKADGSSPRYTKFSAAPPFCIDATKTYTASMQTDAGTITIQLFPQYAPQTVNNFVFLAGYHYFDGIVFHRVIPGFMDQGGDPTGLGTGGPGYTIADEDPKTGAAYDNGAIAMANTGSANTGGSQFFMVAGKGGQELTSTTYAVFGQITGGLDVAQKINDDGNSDSSANGVPPKVLHHIIKLTITES